MSELIWEKDTLTGCFNRGSLFNFLDRLQIESNMAGKPFSIMLIDLDHFKEMNDKRGHAFGDEMLKYFSSTLRLSIETDELTDTPAAYAFRFGGDEFIVVFPGKTTEQAYKLAVNILHNIKHRPCLYRGHSYKISFSGGIATFPRDGETANELIEKADKAMYHSKKTGKGKVSRFPKHGLGNNVPLLRIILVISLIAFSAFLIVRNGKSLLSLAGLGKKIKFKTTKSMNIIKKKAAPIVNFNRVDPQKLSTIYLKNGSELKGEIISRGDPLEVRIVFDQGEGVVSLEQSEILKIEEPKN